MSPREGGALGRLAGGREGGREGGRKGGKERGGGKENQREKGEGRREGGRRRRRRKRGGRKMVVYMLGAKHGFAQSVDCSARSVDPRFARRSMDCPLNLRTVQFTVRKVQIYERSTT